MKTKTQSTMKKQDIIYRIKAAVKAGNTTDLFHTAALAGVDVLDLISDNAKRLGVNCAREARHMVFMRGNDRNVLRGRCEGEYDTAAIMHIVNACVRSAKEEAMTAYSKVPCVGKTGLYLCSPAFGHNDYNKVRLCDLSAMPADYINAIANLNY